MSENKRTEISTLGEFGLIRHLTENIAPRNTSTLIGVGDDCAALSYPSTKALITSDMLLEGVHFDLTYVPLKHLGYKAAMVNFSDVFAMMGQPRQLVISLGLSRRFSLEDVEELYAGLRLAAEKYDVDIIGGDTCPSLTGLTLSITCIGEAKEEEITRRSGAHDTDLICVSGDLGAAYMGLQLLEREKNVFQSRQAEKGSAPLDEETLQPDFSGKEYLLERQLRPEARGDIVAELRKRGLHPTSMIDISDGLSSELMHICTQSHTGCRIWEERLPIDYQTSLMAEELNMNPSTCALNGGEDYELLFTLPLACHKEIENWRDIKIIGHITDEVSGRTLVTKGGGEMPLRAQGWNLQDEL